MNCYTAHIQNHIETNKHCRLHKTEAPHQHRLTYQANAKSPCITNHIRFNVSISSLLLVFCLSRTAGVFSLYHAAGRGQHCFLWFYTNNKISFWDLRVSCHTVMIWQARVLHAKQLVLLIDFTISCLNACPEFCTSIVPVQKHSKYSC